MSRARTVDPEMVAASVGAGIAAVAGSYAAAGWSDGFVAAPVSAALTAGAPGPVVTFAIERLGSLGQPLAFVAALALTAALFAVVTFAAARVRVVGPVPQWLLVALSVGVVAAVLGAPLGALVAGLAAGFVVAVTPHIPAEGESVSATRRRILGSLATAAAIGGVGAVVGTLGHRTTAASGASGTQFDIDDERVTDLLQVARDRSFDLPGTDGLVTGIADHYRVDINSVDPTVDADDWTLRVTGAVEREREFTYADLLAREPEHRFVTLRCVGESLNGKKMDTALWTGVPVMALLGEGSLPDECCVMFRAADGYFEEFPLSALQDAFLAYGMNGKRLPRAHGHPVRALVPGHWGEINVKWLTEIEVLDRPADGYWERRGWHGTGPVNTVAKIHSASRLDDGRVQVGGHAYAGTRDVSAVEVSVDGGRTWTEAELSERLPGRVGPYGSGPEFATDAWRQWRHVYASDGSHEVVVRAIDGDGRRQPREESRPYPSGATGWVSRHVDL